MLCSSARDRLAACLAAACSPAFSAVAGRSVATGVEVEVEVEVEVDVRVHMDEDGNWKKTFEKISTRTANGAVQSCLASYDRALPGRMNDITERQG